MEKLIDIKIELLNVLLSCDFNHLQMAQAHLDKIVDGDICEDDFEQTAQNFVDSLTYGETIKLADYLGHEIILK